MAEYFRYAAISYEKIGGIWRQHFLIF